MKKTLLIVVVILAVILALPVINLIRWTFQAKKPLNIILVDKTVPTIHRVNHKSFDWVLTNERFVKKENNNSYSFRRDYYGFVPLRPLRDKLYFKNDYRLTDILDLADANDVIYFADTYGVFVNEWYEALNISRKSRKLYGEFNNNDLLLVNEMQNRNKLVIMEYNTFDYPTIQYYSVRVQEKLGIRFSGWTGKYFSTLDSTSQDFPIWMTAMYRKQYRKPWTYTKPGIVILNQKDIIVLEEGTHLTNAMPHIITDSPAGEKYELPLSVAFDRWFDIIDPQANNVLSEFKLETTVSGDSLLAINYLSGNFPAVIQDPAAARYYYFSGDFANTKMAFWTARFKGFYKLKSILYSDKPDDPRRFFWLYYRPLMTGILNEYYNDININ